MSSEAGYLHGSFAYAGLPSATNGAVLCRHRQHGRQTCKTLFSLRSADWKCISSTAVAICWAFPGAACHASARSNLYKQPRYFAALTSAASTCYATSLSEAVVC